MIFKVDNSFLPAPFLVLALVVRSHVPTANIFWDVAPCSLVEINRRFVGVYCLHLQGDPL
jgi:hypothetical protein